MCDSVLLWGSTVKSDLCLHSMTTDHSRIVIASWKCCFSPCLQHSKLRGNAHPPCQFKQLMEELYHFLVLRHILNLCYTYYASQLPHAHKLPQLWAFHLTYFANFKWPPSPDTSEQFKSFKAHTVCYSIKYIQPAFYKARNTVHIK